ncbi:ankyrin repeat protein isoform X1 [Biomphalaria pfeifferi]|uniref:Ankyrin repeat protein isoform X1 n=1 Tax=Biomphalaria pfeifferi TaxID=112525 RepID=A0AAD8FKQ9_BIOPF|nr:ankyrin repeat protein isoform X1 [Biomphalaria pfeifferi]
MASRKRHKKQKNQSISILSKARQSPEQIKDLFPNVDCIYPGGRTLLTLAIENGEDISLVEAFIKSGADVNVQNSKGQTALMFAARAQRNDVLQKLLENEAQVDLLNDKNLTALSICIAENNIDGVKHLVQSGADVNLKTGKLQETALAQAKRLGSIHVMDLLERSYFSLTDISLQSSALFTAEQRSARSKEITVNTNEKLRLCLTKFSNLKHCKDNGQKIGFKTFRKLADVFEKNGRLNCQDSSGATLLIYASMQGSRESLEYILNLNPDVNARDCKGRTALMYVFISGMNISKLSLYQVIGDSPCVQDQYGKTALMYAFKNKYRLPPLSVKVLHGGALIRFVKEMNVVLVYDVPETNIHNDNCVIVDKDGRTHLMFAIENIPSPDLHMLKEICDNQLNVQEKSFGLSALMYAVYYNTDLIPFLLDCGADRNLQDKEGKTAFVLALEMKWNLPLALLKELATIEVIHTKDVHGRTALMYAIEHFHSNQLIEHILSLGADVGVQDKDGMTALMIVFKTSLKLWGSILTKLASNDINKQDCLGKTALMYATKYEASEDCFKILMECGADINIYDLSGSTPLMYLLNCTKNICRARSSILNDTDIFLFRNTFLDFHRVHQPMKCFQCLSAELHNLVHQKLSSRNREIIVTYLRNHQRDSLNWYYSNDLKLLRLLWRIGVYLEPEVVRRGHVTETSPFRVALELGHVDITKYILLNNYMTNKDLKFLRQFNLYSLNILTFSFFVRFSTDAIDFAKSLRSQPFSLVKLSFIAVSTCIGLYGDRDERVAKLPIPQILKNYLSFLSPEAEISVCDFKKYF